MYFYPTLTDDLKDAAGISLQPYEYCYCVEGVEYKLTGKGQNVIKFDDEAWKVERDGLRIRRMVVCEYPNALYGGSGIACAGAELGICLTWVNKSLTQMGTILPSKEYMREASKIIEFDYEFAPGLLKGDLGLTMYLYIRKPAENVLPDESSLMNDEGVSVGILDEVHLDFGSMYINNDINKLKLNIAEINDKKQPMWWLELSDWSEPKEDLFNEENICIYLNTAYDSCPKMGEPIKNADVLIDIITTVYVMLFGKIKDCGCLSDTVNDVNLESGSISKMMFFFKSSCETDIDFSTE